MNKAQDNFKLQIWICVLSVILFAGKIVAWRWTNSVAILSDALESIVNVLAGFIGLYSLYVAAKPVDIDHPYGHGKAEFLSAAAEGIMILVAGLAILYNAFMEFFSNSSVEKLDKGLLLVGATAVFNYLFGTYCIYIGKKNNSMALRASGKHLQMDTYTTGAIILGLILVLWLKIDWLDKLIALILGIFISFNGYKIIRQSLAGIMDEADVTLLKEIVDVMEENRRPNWIDVHNLKVVKYGANMHIDFHLTVPYYFTVLEAQAEIYELQKVIRGHFPDSIEFNVHTDPCRDWSCELCTKKDCSVRKHPFIQKVPWILRMVIGPKQQQLKNFVERHSIEK